MAMAWVKKETFFISAKDISFYFKIIDGKVKKLKTFYEFVQQLCSESNELCNEIVFKGKKNLSSVNLFLTLKIHQKNYKTIIFWLPGIAIGPKQLALRFYCKSMDCRQEASYKIEANPATIKEALIASDDLENDVLEDCEFIVYRQGNPVCQPAENLINI